MTNHAKTMKQQEQRHAFIAPVRRAVLLPLLLCGWWLALLLVGTVALRLAGVVTVTLLPPAPPLRDAATYGRAITARDGQLLRLELAPDQTYRLWVPRARIPPRLAEAVLLYEDRRFYWHPGVDPTSLLRATLDVVRTGRGRRGASTITMQLARRLYGLHTRTVPGKLEQLLRALALELRHSKAELLEAYLNLAPYGGNVEGVEAASRIYFGRSVMELTLAEQLTLGVLPQSPTRRRPTRDGLEPPDLLAARQRLAAAWTRVHPTDDAEQTSLTRPLRMQPRAELPFRAPHFVTRLPRTPADDGLLTTTLDPLLQDAAERRLAAYVARRRGEGIRNGALLLVDHHTREVLAWVGAVDFHDPTLPGQVDGVTARRSPGSTLKPFVYGLALDQGLIHPLSWLRDTPHHFGGGYSPENFDGTFLGLLTATDALVRSRNIPAVELASRLSSPGLAGWLEQAGLLPPGAQPRHGLAAVLGGAEVSLAQLVTLYAMLADGGRLRPLVTWRDPAPPAPPPGSPTDCAVLSPAASFLVLQMLSETPPPGPGEAGGGLPRGVAAWKTGTSYGFRDAWTVGVVGPYVLGVWIGHFDGRGNPAFVGRTAAAPLFFELVETLRALRPATFPATSPWTTPPPELNLTRIEVCGLTGHLPGPGCGHRRATWFIPTRSPTTTCTAHPVRAPSVRQDAGPTSPLSALQPAALAARLPGQDPPLRPAPPEITSPRPNVTYPFRGSLTSPQPLPLTAETPGRTGELHWFVDDEYVGHAPPDQPLLWSLRPGRFEVRVVDDAGQVAIRALTVEVVR